MKMVYTHSAWIALKAKLRIHLAILREFLVKTDTTLPQTSTAFCNPSPEFSCRDVPKRIHLGFEG